jgi:hypothetical protein
LRLRFRLFGVVVLALGALGLQLDSPPPAFSLLPANAIFKPSEFKLLFAAFPDDAYDQEEDA